MLLVRCTDDHDDNPNLLLTCTETFDSRVVKPKKCNFDMQKPRLYRVRWSTDLGAHPRSIGIEYQGNRGTSKCADPL